MCVWKQTVLIKIVFNRKQTNIVNGLSLVSADHYWPLIGCWLLTHRSSIRVLSDHHTVVAVNPGLQLVMGARQRIRAAQIQLTSQTEKGKKYIYKRIEKF